MKKRSWFAIGLAALAAAIAVGALTAPTLAPRPRRGLLRLARREQPVHGRTVRRLHADRAFVPGSTDAMHNINTVDLPVNVGSSRAARTSSCTTPAGSSRTTSR
jgi:hypothetical protein